MPVDAALSFSIYSSSSFSWRRVLNGFLSVKMDQVACVESSKALVTLTARFLGADGMMHELWVIVVAGGRWWWW